MMESRGGRPGETPTELKLAEIRLGTRQLVSALMMDVWPSVAVCVDFGIRTPEHLGALQHAVRADGVTAGELDAALGNGPAIQTLISPTNPYRSAVFATDWDHLPEEPEGC